ncbi:MAG: hypothetical protein OXI12_01240, partial [Gammaproteobacteria bacterium]|nr:hypothetical protein [Gammaproteobacteria bacterium]
MTMNWKHIAAVVWLVAVVALILLGQPLAGVIVFAAGAAVLAVLRWTDSLKPDELVSAVVVALAVAVAGHVAHTAVGDTVGTDITDQVDDNTTAIAALDQTAEAAAGYRSELADGEEPLADACDVLLASLDQLRFVGGEPVTAGGEERLHIVAMLARAVDECAANNGDGDGAVDAAGAPTDATCTAVTAALTSAGWTDGSAVVTQKDTGAFTTVACPITVDADAGIFELAEFSYWTDEQPSFEAAQAAVAKADPGVSGVLTWPTGP